MVTLSGTGLQTVSVVFFGSSDASGEIVSQSAGGLQARVPANALTGQISVFSPQGSASSAQIFVAAPRITDVQPPSGGVGTFVTISGANFATGLGGGRGQITSVEFNGTPTDFQITGINQLLTVVPNGAASGSITIANEAGSFSTVTPFFVTALLTGFSPPQGKPGDSIEIQGQNLGTIDALTFGSAAAAFNIVSPTNLLAFVPTNAVNGPVQVTTPAGVAVSSSNFVVTPRIIRFTPTFGQVGTNVVIEGGGFQGLKEVQFNGVKAATVNGESSTRVTAVVPNGAGTGPIKIVTTNGTFTTEANFQFPARVTTFNPTSGVRGDVVTVDGQNLGGVEHVLFHGVEASFTMVSASRLMAVVPPLATTGPIAVVNSGGTNATSSTFTVRPVLDGFTPTTGPAGTAVTLVGAGLTNLSWVRIGDVDATYTVLNSTNVRAIMPLGAYSGPFKVRTASSLEAQAPGIFIVEGATPTLTSFDPPSGAVGMSVTLTGTGLRSTAKVEFNGTSATFTVVSGTEVDTVVPDGATTGLIAVTTLDGIAISPDPFVIGTSLQPAIAIALGENTADLSWPASATGYVLEATGSLGPAAAWQPIDTTPVQDGSQQRVSVPLQETGARFFRLRR